MEIVSDSMVIPSRSHEKACQERVVEALHEDWEEHLDTTPCGRDEAVSSHASTPLSSVPDLPDHDTERQSCRE